MEKSKSTIQRAVSYFAPFVLVPLIFILTDAFWISSLHRWGISYGPTKITFGIFLIVRGGLVLLGLLIKQVSRGRSSWLRKPAIPLLAGNLLITALAIYGFCIEPFQLSQTNLEFRVPGLNQPVRIVQLSDLHIEVITRREQALLNRLSSLSPDMIVMTGDYTSQSYTNNRQTIIDLRSLTNQFQAPLGVYAVNGNAETPYVMSILFKKTDVQLLENEVLRIPELGDHVAIIGLNYVTQSSDEKYLKRLMARVQPDDFTILLYHKPDLAYAARDQKVSLYLTGHTHGGQVRLPLFGAIYTNSIYGKTFEMGEYTLDQTTMYVNRGLGFQGGIAPRVRFLAPPEVVVIDLLPGD